MTALMRSDCVIVPVALGPRSYEIAIGRGVIKTSRVMPCGLPTRRSSAPACRRVK